MTTFFSLSSIVKSVKPFHAPQHLHWDQVHILLQLRIENCKWECDRDGVGHGDKHKDDVGAIAMKA